MRRFLLWAALAALVMSAASSWALAIEQEPYQREQSTGFTIPPLSDEELRQARGARPDAQSQLLAEVFPGTRPEASSGMAPVREQYSRPDGSGILRLEGGAEVVDSRFGFRLGAGGTIYTADGRRGLRLDAATVQGDSQREMLKVLLSGGAKLGDQNQFVVTGGWLNRYTWSNFSDMGDLGADLSQYVLGMELERQLRQRAEDSSPGISAFLSALYFKSDSKTLWRGERTGEDDSSYYRYLYEYGLGGGSQYEAMLGTRLSWKRIALELQAGFRHKEYEEYLGYATKIDDAPKASLRLTLNEILGNELSGYYTWDPDLKVVGASLRRPLADGLYLSARGELLQGEDRPDDARYFLGLEYWFGGKRPKPVMRQSTSSDEAEKRRDAEDERREGYAKGDWLRPVRGSDVEYIQVVRQVQRKTEIWRVDKAGLDNGVTVDKKSGEIVIAGLPDATSIVLVTPGSAYGAFYLSGGQVRIIIAKLPENQNITAQVQQSDGRYSMIRVATSHGSVVVNSVEYYSNLAACQAAALLATYTLKSPPPPPPVIFGIPVQNGTVGVSFSLDLKPYIQGTVTQYELTGDLPNGLLFDPGSVSIFGKPSQNGIFDLILRASNNCGWSNQQLLKIIIQSQPGGGYVPPL